MTQAAELPLAGEDQTRQTPGDMLKLARESQFRTQAEIASRLRLSRQVIQRIESNDFSGETAAVYVKGYLRAYARVLGLEEEVVIDALHQSAIELPQREIKITSIDEEVNRFKHRTRSRNRLLQAVTLLLTALLVTLVTLWWKGQHQTHVASVSAPTSARVDLPQQTIPLLRNTEAPVDILTEPVSAPVTGAAPEVPSSIEAPAAVESSPTVAAPVAEKVAPAQNEKKKAHSDAYQFKITPVHSSRH